METDEIFDYSKYCEMQNGWMASSKKFFRFYISVEEDTNAEDIEKTIKQWICGNPENLEISDRGGSFDKAHPDNTPLEKAFEDLFVEAYVNGTT